MKIKKGMAAMITVIVLGALMVLVGGMMTLTSISEGQATLMEKKSKVDQGVLDACAEESLLRLNANGVVPTLVVTPLGNCNVTVNSQTGTSWDYSIGVNGGVSSRELNVVLDRGTTIMISSWADQ